MVVRSEGDSWWADALIVAPLWLSVLLVCPRGISVCARLLLWHVFVSGRARVVWCGMGCVSPALCRHLLLLCAWLSAAHGACMHAPGVPGRVCPGHRLCDRPACQSAGACVGDVCVKS